MHQQSLSRSPNCSSDAVDPKVPRPVLRSYVKPRLSPRGESSSQVHQNSLPFFPQPQATWSAAEPPPTNPPQHTLVQHYETATFFAAERNERAKVDLLCAARPPKPAPPALMNRDVSLEGEPSAPSSTNGKAQFSPPPGQGNSESSQGNNDQLNGSANGSSNGGSKRKRVSLACNACRLRKSKCDGVRPKCSMCRDLDFDCVYQQSASSANTIVGKDYIGRLETRLLAVENLLAAQASMNQAHQASATPGVSASGEGSPERSSREADEFVTRHKRKREHSPATPKADTSTGETFVNLGGGHLEDDTAAPDTVLDGMGALVMGDEEDYGYFGPSSNIAFIGHVTKALATSVSVTGAFSKDLKHTEAQLETPSRPRTPGPSGGVSEVGEFEVRPGNVNIYVLPAESRVRHFITLYFQNTNILFPYLHQPTFLDTYERALKDGFTKVRRTWLALLNLVMAMGSRASTEKDVSTEDKYKTAEIFYLRGYGLCNEHLLRLASLDSVHLLLLMSHYLQSTRKPVQCWTTHGLAIRVAIQMGLHSNQALQRFPPLERELRKRAWYGCVLLDRTLCMTFGRPSAIAAYADKLDLPLDVEDDALKMNMMTPTMNPIQPPACTSTTFFILSIKLYTLLGMIIDTLYGGNLGGSDPSEPTFTDVARVAEIEEKLSMWRQQLPSALTIVSAADIPEGGGPPSQFWRQSIILSLRYYNTRALLHRQFAVKGLSEIWGAGPSSNKFEGDFFWNFGLASIKVCSDSAIETVEIIHKVKHRSDLLGFWWFTLYYTFNASLVLVSKVLIVSQVRQLALRRDFVPETGSLLKHLEMAMETLEVLATGNRIANRCRLFLKNLMRFIAPLAASSPRTLQTNPPLGLTFDRQHYAGDVADSGNQTASALLTPAPAGNGPPHTHPGQGADELSFSQQYDADGTATGASAVKSPFRNQLGEFMLESDFTYLHSILPPLGMDGSGIGSEGGYDQGGYGLMGGFGA
ncbi:fungal-specific transcription factor domain-containing protein [Geopyxis carbonaria]|nr:fungal-specific transcription factor domain-containing protein [Geopyxis carbonaria]